MTRCNSVLHITKKFKVKMFTNGRDSRVQANGSLPPLGLVLSDVSCFNACFVVGSGLIRNRRKSAARIGPGTLAKVAVRRAAAFGGVPGPIGAAGCPTSSVFHRPKPKIFGKHTHTNTQAGGPGTVSHVQQGRPLRPPRRRVEGPSLL